MNARNTTVFLFIDFQIISPPADRESCGMYNFVFISTKKQKIPQTY
jgi:hypothetical protein